MEPAPGPGVPADTTYDAPSWVLATLRDVAALLAGEPVDLRAVPLDLSGVPAFDQRVYEVARAIPPGGTLTYGQVARRLGSPGASRAVAGALARNPVPVVVPCHRVVGSDGTVGGFSAPGGRDLKRTLLGVEGAMLPL